MAESMVFYRSFWDAIKDLDDLKMKTEAYDVILSYGLDGVIPENLSGTVKVIFTMAKPNIDVAIRNRENGKKGGRPPKKPEVIEDNNHGLQNSDTENHEGLETEKPNVDINGNENVNVNKNVYGDGECKCDTFRKAYGKYKNVLLSEAELLAIIEKYPDVAEYGINRVSEYVATSGKHYSNYFAVVMEWINKDYEKLVDKKREDEEKEINRRQRKEWEKLNEDFAFGLND